MGYWHKNFNKLKKLGKLKKLNISFSTNKHDGHIQRLLKTLIYEYVEIPGILLNLAILKSQF